MTHRLLVKLNDNIKDRNFNLTQFFTLEDYDRRGYVPFYVFRDCIDKINPGIPKSDFLKLDNKYKSKSPDGERDIYLYKKFINDVVNVRKYENTLTKLFDKIKEQMKLGKPDLFQLLENYDDRGRGLVDINDMQTCFKRMSIQMKREYTDAIKFCFESEETGRIEYPYMKKEFMQFLDNLGIDFQSLKIHQDKEDQIDKFWSRNIFLEFYKFFTKNQVLSVKKYFKDEHGMGSNNCVSNYMFQGMMEEVAPNLDSNQTKRFLSDLTDPDYHMISIEKFNNIYNEMTATFNEEELNAHVKENEGSIYKNKVLYMLMSAIDSKGMSFKDYFSQYEFQRQMLTISKKDFYVACGDLEVEESDIQYDDIMKIFDSGKPTTLDLTPLSEFIENYKQDIPFYIQNKKFNRQREFLEELIHYANEIKRADQVRKLLNDEDIDGNGLLGIQTFLSHMNYLDLGIKNGNDHRLLLEKYDTFKEEEINVTEFCLDFETVLKDLYPQLPNSLNKISSKIKSLVERVGSQIVRNHDSIDSWISSLKSKMYGSKIPMNILLVKLKEECSDLKQEELVSIIRSIDRKRKGFVLDFRLKNFFEDFSDEETHPAVKKLVEILKVGKVNLPDYLKPITNSTNRIPYKKFISKLENETMKSNYGHSLSISGTESSSMLIFLNLKNEEIDLTQLQLKLKTQLQSFEVMSAKEIDAFIMGRSQITDEMQGLNSTELATLTGIVEKTIKVLNVRRLSFEELFGEGKTMKRRAFTMRMEDLGIANHIRYSELVESLKVPKVFGTVDLKKFKEMIDSVKESGSRGATDYKKVKEQIQETKEFIKQNDIHVGRIFSQYDDDQSGDINPREFYILLNEIQPGLTRREIADIFKMIDQDNDGVISKLEFEKTFSVSLKDIISSKVKSLSWASPIFAEISQTLDDQMRTLRDAFSLTMGKRNNQKQMTIPRATFRVFLSELDLRSLQSASLTRKLETALKFESSENVDGDIDYFLFKACLDEYENIGGLIEGYNDDVSKVLALICKRFNYDIEKITYIVDMEEDGFVTYREFESVCKDCIPRTRSQNDIGIDKNSIALAFSSLTVENQDSQEIPISDFKRMMNQFIIDQKNRMVQRISSFIIENEDILTQECEKRELQDRSTSNNSKGYITPGTLKRVLENEKYDMTDQELKSLKNQYPTYLKEDRIYYRELFQEIRKAVKESSQNQRKKTRKDKNFKEILQMVKRKMDFDPGLLSDEFLTLDVNHNEMIVLGDCLKIIEEIIGYKLNKNIEGQFCDRLLCIKRDQINYRKVVSLIFTGKTNVKDQYEVMNHVLVSEFAEEICQELKVRKIPSHEFFKYFDADGDGNISIDEFIRETQEICVQYSKKELSQIHQEIIHTYSGRQKIFNLKIFRKLLYGYLMEDCRPLINHLRAELTYRRVSANKFFYENDKSKNRNLEFSEFFTAIQRLDSQIEVIEADILFIYFDRNHDHKINLQEFNSELSEDSYLNEYSHLLNMYLRSHNYTLSELVSLHSEQKKNNDYQYEDGYYDVRQDRFNEENFSKGEVLGQDKFKSKDLPPSTYLTKSQFSVMSSLFLPKHMTKPEVLNDIFLEIDENKDNFVSVSEFEYLFDSNVKDTFDSNLGRLRIEILEDLTRRRTSIGDFFQEIASQNRQRSRNNMIHLKKKLGNFWQPEDLRRCLITYDLEFGEGAEKEMFKLLDSDGDDVIGYNEFFDAILGERTNVKPLAKTIRRVLQKDKVNIKTIFKSIDENQDDTIDFREFSEFIDEMMLNFSYKDVVCLFEYADHDSSGEISSKEILKIFDPKRVKIKKHPNNMVVFQEDLKKAPTWESKWNKLDKNDEGLTATKFSRFLEHINSRLEKFECYEVFDNLDFKHKGFLTLYDIEDYLEDARNTNLHDKSSSESQQLALQNKENLEELRESFAYRNLNGYDIFKKLDYNSNGFMPKRNVETIFSSNQILTKNPTAIRQICNYYQEPHSDLVDYNQMFKDIDKLKPGRPLFAHFLAVDMLTMAKNMRRNLKEFFLGQEANVGDYDGKMSLGEFGNLVSKAWGESGEVTMEKPQKKPRKGERPKKGVFIRRQNDEPTRGEISNLFSYLKSVNQDGEDEKIDREGTEENSEVTFYEFLRLFPRETRKKELKFILKDYEELLTNIKLSMLRNNYTSIWRYLKRKEDKRNFILECEKMPFVAGHSSAGEIKKLASELEQPSRKGFISLPLLSLALEEIEADHSQLSNIQVTNREVDSLIEKSSILRDSGLRKKETPTVMIGEREFTEPEIKQVKQLVSDINAFIEEDGLTYKGVFQEYDKSKSGLVTYSQFDDLLYNDLGVELDDPAIAKPLELTKKFGTRPESSDEIDYMKLKDLIDGKLDKKVMFSLHEQDKQMRGSAPPPENALEISKNIDENSPEGKEITSNINKVINHYKLQNLTKHKLFARFTKNGDSVTKESLAKTLVKEVKLSEDQSNKIFNFLLEKQNAENGSTEGSKALKKDFFIQKFIKATIDLTPVKIDGDFEQQVEQVFNLVDINQNGVINRQELKLGCKKLGLNMNDKEINDLFESFKHKDGAQTLNKQEFTDLIGYKFRNDLIKPATMMNKLKTEIGIIDVNGSGFLNVDQLDNLYKRMGLEASEEEIEGIIEEIGDQESGEVFEDKLLHAVIGKDQRFKNPEMNKAMIKLRGASSPSLGEFINSFANMPENFFLSFTDTLMLYGQNLPASVVAPKLSASGFYYTNLYPPLKLTGGKNKDRNKKDMKAYQNVKLSSHIRVTVPNFMIKLRFIRATGIPLPSTLTMKNASICSRSLRVILLKNSDYVANLCEIPARYNPNYEDRWYFDKMDSVDVKVDLNAHKNDNLSTLEVFGGHVNGNNVIIKKGNYDLSQDVGLEIVIELVSTMKRKDCNHEIIMSNGYSKIRLAELKKQTSLSLDIHGGDPIENELRINPEEIRKGRHGFAASFLGIFEGKVTSKLELKVIQSFTDIEKQQIAVLPETCIVSQTDLLNYSVFRQVVGYEAFKFPNMTNTNVHNLLFVKTFQNIYNITTVKHLWNWFFDNSIVPILCDYSISQIAPIYQKMMQKLYLMLNEKDFHFSKDFQTRNYHGNKFIQLKRLKLCRKYFRQIFTIVLREVQLLDMKNKIKRKYKPSQPVLPKALQLLQSEKISFKNQKEFGGKLKAFNVMELVTNDSDEEDGFGNIVF